MAGVRGRAGAAVPVLAALTVLGACRGGGGGGRAGGPTSAPSTSTPVATSTTAPVTTTTGATAVTDPPGAVTLHATALVLPDTRAGGGGLRVVVHPASGDVVVRRPGTGTGAGAGALSACPVADAVAAVSAAACVALDAGRAVDLPMRGVDIRATGGDVAVDEVTVTWVPADRSMTLVTPARPAGACAAQPCQASFSVTPPRPGAFSLDGHPGGGRPRLVLVSNTPAAGSIRTLATVEGGGSLSIRATLQAGEQAVLTYSEQGAAAVAALPADVSWP